MENILLDQVLQQVQNKEISIEKSRELICVLFDVVKQSELLCDECKTNKTETITLCKDCYLKDSEM